MKINDKVKALVDGKYVPGIVKDVENAAGFGKRGGNNGGYKYQKVWVEFIDESVKQYRDFDLIQVFDEEKEEKKEKVAKKK